MIEDVSKCHVPTRLQLGSYIRHILGISDLAADSTTVLLDKTFSPVNAFRYPGKEPESWRPIAITCHCKISLCSR